MAKKAAVKKVVKKATAKKAAVDLDDIRRELAKEGKIMIVWSFEDVKTVCPDLTDDQCREVLFKAERRHDASVGINWDVLEAHGWNKTPDE